MTNVHEHLFRKLKKKSQEGLVALLELLVELPLSEASA